MAGEWRQVLPIEALSEHLGVFRRGKGEHHEVEVIAAHGEGPRCDRHGVSEAVHDVVVLAPGITASGYSGGPAASPIARARTCGLPPALPRLARCGQPRCRSASGSMAPLRTIQAICWPRRARRCCWHGLAPVRTL